MGAAGVALGASVVAGAAAAILLAFAPAARRSGVRPRRWLRAADRLALRAGCVAAIAAPALGVAGARHAKYAPTALGLTCVAVATLIALATWLLLIEPDDGGGGEPPDEPEWWPAFERDFAQWTRGRAPVGGRR